MKNRKHGIVLSYINTTLNMITGIFLSSFYIRQLGNTEYGIYESISSFVNYLVLLEFGTGTVMTRNLSLCFAKKTRENEIRKNISTIFFITIVLAMIIMVVSVIFYLSIERIYSATMTEEQIGYSKNIFIFLIIYLVVSFFTQTMNGLVLAYENYTYSSKVSIVKIIVKTILIVSLISLRKKAIYIAVVDAIISCVILVFTHFYCKKKYNTSLKLRDFDKNVLINIFPLCLAIFLQTIVNQANNNVDKFVISIMISPEAVSVYSVALYVFSMFSIATTIPISLYAPQIIKDVGTGIKGKDLVDKLIQPSRLIVIIGGLLLFGFVSVGKPFIKILYGGEYIQAWIIGIIIMLPMFVNMSNGIIVNVLDAMNKRIIRSVTLLITTICNIILTVFFIKIWGMVGAAIATMICTILGQVLIMNYYYYKKLELPIFYMFKKVYKGILLFQVIAMAFSFIVSSCISNKYLSFILGGILFFTIFTSLFILLGKNDTEAKFIRKIIAKFLGKEKKNNGERNNI